MLHVLQSASKWTLAGSLLLLIISLFYKDDLPDPQYYMDNPLREPRQEASLRKPFWVETEGQRYRINPLHDYTLEGVIVSYHNADAFSDI